MLDSCSSPTSASRRAARASVVVDRGRGRMSAGRHLVGDVAAAWCCRARHRRSRSGGGRSSSSDLAVAVLRSFVQLTAIGYVIQAIFDSDSLWLVAALLPVMVGFGAFTARGRGRGRARRARAARARASARRGGHARPGAGARRVRGRAALPRAGRRDGDRQLDDRRGGGAQPPRRRGARPGAAIEAMLALGATSRQAAHGARHPQPALGDDPADRLDQDDRRSSSSRARWWACCSPAPSRSTPCACS